MHGSIYHCTKQFSDSYENRITSGDEPKVTLREGEIDSLIREILNMVVIDSGCIKAVLEILGSTVFWQTSIQTDLKAVGKERSETTFKFQRC